jgi:hypothetical protein
VLVCSTHSRRFRQRLLARAVALAVVAVSLSSPALADTCYRDDSGRIVKRRQPGFPEVPCPPANAAPGNNAPADANAAPGATQLQGPEAASFPGGRQAPENISPLPRPQLTDYTAAVPLPDRWRIVDALGYKSSWLDPYNRNVLKADRPVHGNDWFFNLGLISDSVFESRQLPTGVGGSSTRAPGENDLFGNANQQFFSQNIAAQLVYFKGDTVFKPPDYEFRLTPVINYTHLSLNELMGVNVDPRAGTSRNDSHLGIQDAFFDMRLRDVSERFDFDSMRLGIQPFSSDFRGFLFQDNQLGARFFGTRNNNTLQYNVAWFRMLEKDTNSGLNDLAEPLRHDDVFIFNLYRQDLPVEGFTSQGIIVYNRDREAGEIHYDSNGFISRPEALGIETARDYDIVYFGYNGDGHFGRYNLTASAYYATGRERPGTFVDINTRVSAYFAAA